VRVRFLADADLHSAIVTGLRNKNPSIKFQNAHGVIPKGTPDPKVLAFAANQGRVVVSHDCNTMPGHFYRFIIDRESPGLVLIPQQGLELIWECYAEDEIRNRIVYLPL
jgi:hypothetical protein